MYDFIVSIFAILIVTLPATFIYFIVKRTPSAKKVVLNNLYAMILFFVVGVILTPVDEDVIEDNSSNVSQAEVSTPTQESSTSNTSYTEVTTDTLISALKENALRADASYNKENIKLTGKLYNIDSSGKYLNLESMSDPWDFTSISCYVTDDSQLDQIIQMNKGDIITISGKVTLVGEFLGYSIDIHTIH